MGEERNNLLSEIQSTKSKPLAKLCKAIKYSNLFNTNTTAPVCTHVVAAVEKMLEVQKHLKLSFRMRGSNKRKLRLE